MNKIPPKIKKGVKHPRKVPPFLLSKFFPKFAERHGIYSSVVDVRDDFITWRLGGFVQGARSRPEFCARIYYDINAIHKLLEDVTPTHFDCALEIGCGYGRLTPWIADFATEAHAIDPNESAIRTAQEQYTHVNFETAFAQDLPYSDDSFDLIVTWTVLQSISPDMIQDVATEIMRVLAPDGTLVLAEQVEKPDRKITWSRSESEYEELFTPLEIIESRPRPVEPTFDPEYYTGAVYDETTGRTYHPVERLLALSQESVDNK